MTQFLSTTLSRDEFLDWVGSGGSGAGADLERAVSTADAEREVTLLWDERTGEGNGRPLVAIPVREMAEFFAFTATYIATFKPFTAFFRVVPLELATAVSARRPPKENLREPFARLVAGAALAEQYIHARSPANEPIRSALATMKMTLSAALGTAVVAGYPATAIAWLADQWQSVSRRANTPSTDRAASEIGPIWPFLLTAVHGEIDGANYHGNASARSVSEFVLKALEGGITLDLLQSLGPGLPKEIDPAKSFVSSREERIIAYNRFVAGMGETVSDGLEQPFIAGLLLAIAGNGSFDMLRSAKDLADKSPVAIIWFGICAALFADSNVLTTANCVGRRFVRDVCFAEELFSAPRSDLNAFEYRTIVRDPVAIEQMVSTSSETFCVELLPNVITYVSKPARDQDVRQSDEYQLLMETLQELRYVVDRTQRRLARSPEQRQRELFRGDSKPRGRQR